MHELCGKIVSADQPAEVAGKEKTDSHLKAKTLFLPFSWQNKTQPQLQLLLIIVA